MNKKKREVRAAPLILIVAILYTGVRYFIEGDNFLSVFSGATGILFVLYAVAAACALTIYLAPHVAGLRLLRADVEFLGRVYWRGLKRLLVLNGLLLAALYALHGGAEQRGGQWYWESTHLWVAGALAVIYLLFRIQSLLSIKPPRS